MVSLSSLSGRDARTMLRGMRPLIHPRIRIFAAACAAGLLAAVLPASAAHAATPSTVATVSGWTQVTHYLESSLSADDGVATVNPPGGSAYQLYRGVASVPLSVLMEGYNHVGDPDSVNGYIFDAFQSGASSPSTKMFR